jgi:23S rRNA (pseudouridine1915-N3)-methyltransferase
MRLRLIAVGTRMPEWVDAAFNEYWRRMRGLWKLELIELPTASRRHSGGAALVAMTAEAQKIVATLAPRDFVVALDEHGSERTTKSLSRWLEQRRASGQDLAFIIGGPDGLSEEVLVRAHLRLSLSRLTLPHGLARVVLAEQLYRAATLLAAHPYHRE